MKAISIIFTCDTCGYSESYPKDEMDGVEEIECDNCKLGTMKWK